VTLQPLLDLDVIMPQKSAGDFIIESSQ